MDPADRPTCQDLLSHPYFDTFAYDRMNEDQKSHSRQQQMKGDSQKSRTGHTGIPGVSWFYLFFVGEGGGREQGLEGAFGVSGYTVFAWLSAQSRISVSPLFFAEIGGPARAKDRLFMLNLLQK